MDLVPAGDKAFFKAEATGRVTCTLNGHTFPALEEPIKAFVRCATPLAPQAPTVLEPLCKVTARRHIRESRFYGAEAQSTSGFGPWRRRRQR